MCLHEGISVWLIIIINIIWVHANIATDQNPETIRKNEANELKQA